MVLIEIFTKDLPYDEIGGLVGWKQAVTVLLEKHRRPMLQGVIPTPVKLLINRLIFPFDQQRQDNARPQVDSFQDCVKLLKSGTFGTEENVGIVDSLVGETEERFKETNKQVNT